MSRSFAGIASTSSPYSHRHVQGLLEAFQEGEFILFGGNAERVRASLITVASVGVLGVIIEEWTGTGRVVDRGPQRLLPLRKPVHEVGNARRLVIFDKVQKV